MRLKSSCNVYICIDKVMKEGGIAIIDNLLNTRAYAWYEAMCKDPGYSLICYNPSLKDAYAIFSRCSPTAIAPRVGSTKGHDQKAEVHSV